MALSAIAVTAGFILPWFAIPEQPSVYGWGVAMALGERGSYYWLLYLLPIAALLSAFVGFKWRRTGAFIAAALGCSALLVGLFEVARLLYEVTFGGLWLSVAGCVGMLITGLIGVRAHPSDKKEKNQSSGKDQSATNKAVRQDREPTRKLGSGQAQESTDEPATSPQKPASVRQKVKVDDGETAIDTDELVENEATTKTPHSS